MHRQVRIFLQNLHQSAHRESARDQGDQSPGAAKKQTSHSRHHLCSETLTSGFEKLSFVILDDFSTPRHKRVHYRSTHGHSRITLSPVAGPHELHSAPLYPCQRYEGHLLHPDRQRKSHAQTCQVVWFSSESDMKLMSVILNFVLSLVCFINPFFQISTRFEKRQFLRLYKSFFACFRVPAFV